MMPEARGAAAVPKSRTRPSQGHVVAFPARGKAADRQVAAGQTVSAASRALAEGAGAAGLLCEEAPAFAPHLCAALARQASADAGIAIEIMLDLLADATMSDPFDQRLVFAVSGRFLRHGCLIAPDGDLLARLALRTNDPLASLELIVGITGRADPRDIDAHRLRIASMILDGFFAASGQIEQG